MGTRYSISLIQTPGKRTTTYEEPEAE
jgi:hypothetical protein